jgi:hypothetical protein
VHDEVRADPHLRFGATLTLAADLGQSFRFIVIGDSGLRLNAVDVAVDDTALDLVTAALRQEAYAIVAEAGGGLAEQRRVSRICSFYGASTLHPEMKPWLDARGSPSSTRGAAPAAAHDSRTRRRATSSTCSITASAARRATRTTREPFQLRGARRLRRPVGAGARLRPAARVAAVDRALHRWLLQAGGDAGCRRVGGIVREVERIDPEKIDAYPSVKGTNGRIRTDDRTVVIVHL